MSENYYQILGIPRDADEREIKKAYHRLARELHPDKAATPEAAKEMEHKFAVASTAYNLLKDPEQRKEYDRKNFGSTQAPSRPASAAPSRPSAPSAADPAASSRPAATKPPSAPPSASSTAASMPADVDARRAQIAQKAYVKGVQLIRERDFAHAAEFLEAAINNNPTEAAYHARYALALVEAKKSAAKAIEAAQKAIDLDKYNLEYKFNLAMIFEQIGSKTNAIKQYEDILKWDKDNQKAKQMLRTLTKTEGVLDKIGELSPTLGNLIGKFRKNPYQ